MKRTCVRSFTYAVAPVIVAAVLLSQACGSDRPSGLVPATPTPTAVRHEVSFAPPVSYPVPWAPWSIFAADFDRDGHPDVAFYCAYEPTVSTLHNLGAGFHEDDIPWKDVSGLASADFDGDGTLDLAVVDYRQVTTLLGNGDGSFHSPRALRVDLPYPGSGPVVGDVNGDGLPDLLVGVQYGFMVLIGDGTGHFFRTGRHFVPSLRGNWGALTLGDFDRDGKLDVVLVDAPTDKDPAAVSIALGNGDTTFQPWQVVDGGPSPGSSAAAAADLNGDGVLDLVVANLQDGKAAAGSAAILLGNGDGTFRAPQLYEAGSSWPVTADFNGDGILDIAMPRRLFHDVAVVTGRGDATFAAPVFVAAGPQPFRLAVADFNGDGQPDLAITSLYGRTVSLLFSNW